MVFRAHSVPPALAFAVSSSTNLSRSPTPHSAGPPRNLPTLVASCSPLRKKQELPLRTLPGAPLVPPSLSTSLHTNYGPPAPALPSSRPSLLSHGRLLPLPVCFPSTPPRVQRSPLRSPPVAASKIQSVISVWRENKTMQEKVGRAMHHPEIAMRVVSERVMRQGWDAHFGTIPEQPTSAVGTNGYAVCSICTPKNAPLYYAQLPHGHCHPAVSTFKHAPWKRSPTLRLLLLPPSSGTKHHTSHAPLKYTMTGILPSAPLSVLPSPSLACARECWQRPRSAASASSVRPVDRGWDRKGGLNEGGAQIPVGARGGRVILLSTREDARRDELDVKVLRMDGAERVADAGAGSRPAVSNTRCHTCRWWVDGLVAGVGGNADTWGGSDLRKNAKLRYQHLEGQGGSIRLEQKASQEQVDSDGMRIRKP
ncbi:hypothetical protein BJY52DRAFT_1223695 [Lactarius psammicola]|nr:hypothetical protein BJY52DRAFT_1223695 [Lactarius psammicola]